MQPRSTRSGKHRTKPTNKPPILSKLERVHNNKTMKQEKDPFEIALKIAFICIIYGGMLLSFVYILRTYFIEQPTNTTMHQPEPTEQYADSLVCPD